jgi:hypothetical protein
MPAKSNLRRVRPPTEKRAVAPRRQPNRALRTREHLTETEVAKLINAAKDTLPQRPGIRTSPPRKLRAKLPAKLPAMLERFTRSAAAGG